MAESRPKQRFNPRATLYSPPPSLTRKSRVVQILYSPGSKRSMTSPRLTKSQRHASFALMARGIFSLLHVSNLRGNQFRAEKMDEQQRKQISGRSDEKWNHIAACPLQNVANDFGGQHPTNRSSHSAYPDERSNGPKRKRD